MKFVLPANGPLDVAATLARYHVWGEDPANRVADESAVAVRSATFFIVRVPPRANPSAASIEYAPGPAKVTARAITISTGTDGPRFTPLFRRRAVEAHRATRSGCWRW